MEVDAMDQAESESAKKSLAEQLWLAYFNSYLYEHGVISEADRNRMAIQIKNRNQSKTRSRTMER